jgi:DNA-binding MarR family transcriptional regulator
LPFPIVIRYIFSAVPDDLTIADYRALADFRYRLRRFLHFSERAARAARLEPQQHQLLLALRGIPDGVEATVGALAERLQIQHHSTVELVDRMEEHGLVRRHRGRTDRRQVRVGLTPRGERLLRLLSEHHRAELRALTPMLVRSLGVLTRDLGGGATAAVKQ